MHNVQQLSINSTVTWYAVLTLTPVIIFSSATDMSSIFLMFVENDKLKFRVQNCIGTAQLYREQLASADAPSPIAGGSHVWESLSRMCDNATQQFKDGDDSPAAVS